jgi:hypothetical protein
MAHGSWVQDKDEIMLKGPRLNHVNPVSLKALVLGPWTIGQEPGAGSLATVRQCLYLCSRCPPWGDEEHSNCRG